ncbi:MAG: class II glutamine amidotransferase [Nitrospiraceae bacterium]|nr:MAG: class II glutamine amidotransferase [Nitrospiraceae bacterium]
MCRLFGILANQPVDLEFSLMAGEHAFRDLSKRNPDGWGIGSYTADVPKLVKEPVAATASRTLPRIATSPSRLSICHVRKATGTPVAERNCHPFQFHKWVFAHNGSVNDHTRLKDELDFKHRAAIVGDTDSEVYFHWVLQNIEKEGDVVGGVSAAIRKISDYTGLNFLLADGEKLYAYRDASHHVEYYSLFYLERDPKDPGPTAMRSQELRVLIESKALRGEKAVLVCSERLTDEDWKEVPGGHLLTVGSDLAVSIERVR